MNAKYIIILVLLIFLVLFLVANSSPAQVHFLFFRLETSQAVLILISALIGFLIGLAVLYKQQRKKKEKQ
ncbi:MAG: DUF1049 domain-containing protein [candidate division Zixibacteria bacterium]|nr:DUF1049 domain-containing protein [candidate division Zixibacteria bacterium]